MNTDMQPANKIGYLFEHLNGIWSRQSDQVLQEQLGIGLSQYKIMMAMQWNPKTQQRRLAQMLGQTEASVSRQVKLLLEKGMLTTKVNPKERRERLTEITPKGLKIAQAARKAMAAFHAPMFEELSEKQMKQLLETLITLHAYVCQPGKTYSCNHPLGI
ncbi:MAG TPA: MarR family winged helix-turn-helix transcriptional regulator [Candidatus Saccharimonadales bacterium]|nr:MarR family winged helix-turn-helix transcriptional regulator [Candidatus Saccharimonadales bacterium]